jgi:hypothetical protein
MRSHCVEVWNQTLVPGYTKISYEFSYHLQFCGSYFLSIVIVYVIKFCTSGLQIIYLRPKY